MPSIIDLPHQTNWKKLLVTPLAMLLRIEAWTRRCPRLLLGAGCVFAAWLAVAATARFVELPSWYVTRHLGQPGDIENLYFAAAKASWRDIPGWFAGPWNSPDVGYYRPITSTLFFVEYHAFGRDFESYNRVSLLLHGLNAALLFLLVCSLLRHWPRVRVAAGLVAAYYFATPAGSMFFAPQHCVNYWPAQNDTMSLTFGLASLLALDSYLVGSRRRALAAAVVLMAAAICTKEMGYVTVVFAMALTWHRRRRLAWELALVASVGAAFWILRKLVVPNAWGGSMFAPWAWAKGLRYWTGSLYVLASAGIFAPIEAAVGIAATAALGSRMRWRTWITVITALLIACVALQFGGEGGTWALLFDGNTTHQIAQLLTMLGAVWLFWKYRREEPGLFASAAFVLVFVPILQFAGYHYFYWPAAFVGLADGIFCACLYRWVRDQFRASARASSN